MVIEVTKKPGENTKSLIRRFTRRIQQSRVLINARKQRFLEKEKSKRDRRASAVRRVRVGKEKEKLRKMGLLEEENKYSRRR